MADKERCPACGDVMDGNRCRFCGYVPTQYDVDARSKWEAQKQALDERPDATTGTFDTVRVVTKAVAKAAAGTAAKAVAAGKNASRKGHAREGPVGKTQGPAPDRKTKRVPGKESREGEDAPSREPANKAKPKAPKESSGKTDARNKPSGKRPGRLHRMLWGLLVAAWFSLYLFLVGRKLYDDWQERRDSAPVQDGLENWDGDVPEGSEVDA